MVRSVTRQVEPEWDNLTRERAEALALYDHEVCPGCGLHPVILDDPEHNVFTFEDRLCQVCAGQSQHGRRLAAADEADMPKDKEGNPVPKRCKVRGHPPKCTCAPQPGDGRHTIMRPMSPEEISARQATTRPPSPHPRATGPARPRE